MCSTIVSENNQIIKCQEKILEAQKCFYEKLCKRDEEVLFTLSNSTDVRVSEGVKQKQEEAFTKEEITTAVRQLARNKTPGLSGLSSDFFKMFWTKIGDTFYEAICHMYTKRMVPNTMKKSVLNLIPKINCDLRFLKNLCPISLFSTSYKVIEKAVANRLETSLPEVINRDQQGFMKDRQMATNIRLIFDLLKYCELNNIDGLILSLDFEKCFDKIEHKAGEGALRYFNFAEYIVNWVNLLYQDATAAVQNNGNFSKPFSIERGIRQGGCTSAVLFLICAETLAIELRNSKDIKGIPVNEIINLLGQFADDIDIYQLFNQKSLDTVFEILEQYRKQTGFTINYDKTQIYRIGSLKNSSATLYTQKPISWTNDEIKVLGTYILANDADAISRNYKDYVAKIRSIFKMWSKQNITL